MNTEFVGDVRGWASAKGAQTRSQVRMSENVRLAPNSGHNWAIEFMSAYDPLQTLKGLDVNLIKQQFPNHHKGVFTYWPDQE